MPDLSGIAQFLANDPNWNRADQWLISPEDKVKNAQAAQLQQASQNSQLDFMEKQRALQTQDALRKVFSSGKGLTEESVNEIMALDADVGLKLLESLRKRQQGDISYQVSPVTGEVIAINKDTGSAAVIPLAESGAPVESAVPVESADSITPITIPPEIANNPRAKQKFLETKAAKEAELASEQPAKDNAKGKFSTLITEMRNDLGELDQMGALGKVGAPLNENIANYIARSDIGAEAGRALGSPAQERINTFVSKKPLLLQSIMAATGMSAKQLDSNTELKMYMDSLGNPQNTYKTNMAILSNIEKLFSTPGKGGDKKPDRSAVEAELRRRGLID